MRAGRPAGSKADLLDEDVGLGHDADDAAFAIADRDP